MKRPFRTLRFLWLLTLLIAGCRADPAQSPAAESTLTLTENRVTEPATVPATPLETRTPTPFPALPSPTTVPLALSVNGETITFAEYEASLSRYLAGVEGATPESAASRVIADFLDQLLLAQAAREAGFALEEEVVDARIAALADDLGGMDALSGWWTQNGYTPESFRVELARGITAAWMRDRILADVPETLEQVRARHILVASRSAAEQVLARLDGGASFDDLIVVYDPISLGELGWFPRGYLFEPAIEEAAFALQPGEYSGVVETPLGFHIVQVTDYAEDQALAPDVRWVLGNRALESWLERQREQSDIQVYLP